MLNNKIASATVDIAKPILRNVDVGISVSCRIDRFHVSGAIPIIAPSKKSTMTIANNHALMAVIGQEWHGRHLQAVQQSLLQVDDFHYWLPAQEKRYRRWCYVLRRYLHLLLLQVVPQQ